MARSTFLLRGSSKIYPNFEFSKNEKKSQDIGKICQRTKLDKIGSLVTTVRSAHMTD